MCDTFVAVSSARQDESMIFGKNSDREPNEAQSLEYYPPKKSHALTGIDLLRLALERASTAQQGLVVITGLLADWGQGGACGYEDINLFYHNSYILVDKKAGPVPKGLYNPETLWWQHERLHRKVLKDYSKIALYQEERDQMESSFLKKAADPRQSNGIELTRQAFA